MKRNAWQGKRVPNDGSAKNTEKECLTEEESSKWRVGKEHWKGMSDRGREFQMTGLQRTMKRDAWQRKRVPNDGSAKNNEKECLTEEESSKRRVGCVERISPQGGHSCGRSVADYLLLTLSEQPCFSSFLHFIVHINPGAERSMFVPAPWSIAPFTWW